MLPKTLKIFIAFIKGTAMTSLSITMKGQVTLKRDLLQHLGLKPGERIELDKLPGGELRLRAARPAGTIDSFIGRHKGRLKKPLTIDEMNDIAAAGWAGEPGKSPSIPMCWCAPCSRTTPARAKPPPRC